MDSNIVKKIEDNNGTYVYNNFNYSNITNDFTNEDNWLLTKYFDETININYLYGDNYYEIHANYYEYERIIKIKNEIIISDVINKKDVNGIMFQYENEIIPKNIMLQDYLANKEYKKFKFQDRTLDVTALSDDKLLEVSYNANEINDRLNNNIKLLRIKEN